METLLSWRNALEATLRRGDDCTVAGEYSSIGEIDAPTATRDRADRPQSTTVDTRQIVYGQGQRDGLTIRIAGTAVETRVPAGGVEHGREEPTLQDTLTVGMPVIDQEIKLRQSGLPSHER